MELVWSSAPHLDGLYLEATVSKTLGILVFQETQQEVPRVVFFSLFDKSPIRFERADVDRMAGFTFAEARKILDELEAAVVAKPFVDIKIDHSND